MDFAKILGKYSDDWIFNSLQIENFSETSKSRLRHWFDHLKENHSTLPGDIFEFGVYKGGGAIGMAILLKILGSKKQIYAFDSFNGFPSYDSNDELEMFEIRSDLFNKAHRAKARLCRDVAEWRLNHDVDPSNISMSGDFSDVSRTWLEARIDKFGLDNITLIEGSFEETLPKFFNKYDGKIFSANIDCDLYSGYKICLEAIFGNCVSGGMIYLDEYYSLKFPGARIAVSEFLADKNESPKKLFSEKNEFERWAIIKE